MRKDPGSIRLARIEAVEHRIMLSVQPAAETVADFFVDYSIGQLDQALETSLADAHGLTGLIAARNDYGLDGAGQTVVIIDTGVAYDHLALGGGFGANYRVVGGFDFTNRHDTDPYDDGPMGSHGTHVAGIIASSDSHNTGVAPSVDIVALRVFDDQGYGELEWVEEALSWVHQNIDTFENPITTVNLSLGVVYNADGVPSWATFEDELAQLENDGLFISVAAGNKFTSYNAAGLSYPAVSEHVVPVASLDNDGSMSFYSQRNSRVIAAPGRSITSTVPDYLGNDNGIDDDFATYSGTSMAAPYVAGASILIRQAYEFVGVGNVTQATIYDLMCSTADTVYDPVTKASYFSLNIDRALDTIMPDDDFGSTWSSAYGLGSITDTLSVEGTVGRLDDADWFSFTAAADGIVTFSADTTDALEVDW
ncbi:MAG: S8 family serine peptidase, partial [Planctomycetota bacterium]|nr:S8 family serine peptidase [Planctomycetota bacterium]